MELHKQGKLQLCVTQNTEGLQELAGLPAEALVTIHGSRRHVLLGYFYTSLRAQSCTSRFRFDCRQRNCMRRRMDEWLDFSSMPRPEKAMRMSCAATALQARSPCRLKGIVTSGATPTISFSGWMVGRRTRAVRSAGRS